MPRTTANPKLRRVTVRLTEDEHRALEILRRDGGYRYLNDALRSLVPKLRLGPAETSSSALPQLLAEKAKGRQR